MLGRKDHRRKIQRTIASAANAAKTDWFAASGRGLRRRYPLATGHADDEDQRMALAQSVAGAARVGDYKNFVAYVGQLGVADLDNLVTGNVRLASSTDSMKQFADQIAGIIINSDSMADAQTAAADLVNKIRAVKRAVTKHHVKHNESKDRRFWLDEVNEQKKKIMASRSNKGVKVNLAVESKPCHFFTKRQLMDTTNYDRLRRNRTVNSSSSKGFICSKLGMTAGFESVNIYGKKQDPWTGRAYGRRANPLDEDGNQIDKEDVDNFYKPYNQYRTGDVVEVQGKDGAITTYKKKEYTS